MGVAEWWRRLTGGTSGADEAAGRSATGTQANRKGAQTTGTSKGAQAKSTSKGAQAKGKGKGAQSADQAGTHRTKARTTHHGPTGKPGRQADIDRAKPVLGLAASRSGWVGAHLESTGHGTPQILAGATLHEVISAAGPVTVVAVDVPVGLPDESRRAVDGELRRLLGPQAAAVLSTPVREALYAPSYGEANRINRERQGAGVSRQAYDVRRQIMDVDEWLRKDRDHQVVEVNSEASLAQAAGEPLASRRSSADGAHERREVLARVGIYVPTSAPHGVLADDLVAACAAAWSAHRVKSGQAHTYPAQPETFSDGLASAVHV